MDGSSSQKWPAQIAGHLGAPGCPMFDHSRYHWTLLDNLLSGKQTVMLLKMVIYSEFTHIKMVIFYSYVSLPVGIWMNC